MAIKIAGVDVINDDRELVLAKLTDINSTISSTAVDVFVYDTRNDSDGGAWRHRTQHTSWYNEAASSTRGSRKEFPAVAVIVAEEHTITIYDGDDPSLPMWMVFPANSGALGGVTAAGLDLTSVAMLNGVLVGGYGNGLSYVNFLSEVLERGFNVNTANVGVMPFNVAERDQSPVGLGGALNLEIVNSAVNDVAMTVLPDAPTDPATGIAVPTIAVATDGGVSVIRDDGTVADSADTYAVKSVNFDANNFIWYPRDGGSTQRYSQTYAADGFQGRNWQSGFPTAFASSSTITLTDSTKDAVVLGATNTNQGISQLHVDASSESNSMVAYTTSSYNTGWMNGDIKLAALADTTAETLGDAASGATVSDPNGDGVYDGEHVTNGKFTTDTSGWTAQNSATLSATGAELTVTNGSATLLGYAADTITTEIGKSYTLSVDVTDVSSSGSNGARIRVGTSLGISDLGQIKQTSAATVTHTFVAETTTTYLRVGPYDQGSGYAVSFDNISIRLADPDRSVKGRGLGVHGSITKSAVATGADVVAYSGFSTSNYLEQPYNADLDFGANDDFCVMGWFKTSSLSTDEVIFNRSDDALADPLIEIRTDAAGNRLRCFIGDPGYNNLTNYYSSTISTGVWYLISLVRSGTSLSWYINGQLDTSGTSSQDLTNTSAKARLGVRYLSGTYSLPLTNGSLALLRISGTAPTANQIRKIYEDEKVLFQPNAKATLTGSSDTVTALAHDPDTNLLHVGTSGGRSVFQGLRRVEEHTGTNSQSLAAISAVDGLVVEGK